MLPLSLLNLLIEAERLKALVQVGEVEALMQALPAWRQSVEAEVGALASPLPADQLAAIGQLQQSAEALDVGLGELGKQIARAQAQALKGNAAAHAYAQTGV